MKAKPINYVDGRTLHNELVEWYRTCNDKTRIPLVIVRAIEQICERLATSRNFRGYSYIDDMVSSAKLACTIALQERKYNPNRSETPNPFAYFTQIAHNEFIRIIKEEKRESYIKHKSFEMHMIHASLVGDTSEMPQLDGSGRIEELVNKFEKKKPKKNDKQQSPSVDPSPKPD